jgi:hypothetical protein
MLRRLRCCVLVALKSGGGPNESRRRIRIYRQTFAAKWTLSVK